MTLQGQTILITGATGFLGEYLVKAAAEAGAVVRALARRPERAHYIRDVPHVDIVQGDITDVERMRDVTRGADYVLHSAAALGGSLAWQQRINVKGTENVARTAVDAGVRRLVHVSTIAVYGYRQHEDVTEDTPHNPGHDAYAVTKSRAEHVLKQIAGEGGLDTAIIRPGMIYGPRSSFWTALMFRLAMRGPLWIGDGFGSAYPIYADDVADLTLLAVEHPAASGEAFNCTPDPSPTWRQFLGAYAALAGKPADGWQDIPPSLLKGAAAVVAPLLPDGSQAKDLPEIIPFVLRYITFRTEKAHRLLGWSPRVSLEDGVARCAPYLREKGLLR